MIQKCFILITASKPCSWSKAFNLRCTIYTVQTKLSIHFSLYLLNLFSLYLLLKLRRKCGWWQIENAENDNRNTDRKYSTGHVFQRPRPRWWWWAMNHVSQRRLRLLSRKHSGDDKKYTVTGQTISTMQRKYSTLWNHHLEIFIWYWNMTATKAK